MLAVTEQNPHRADPRTACSLFIKKIGDEIDLPALGGAIARVVQLASADDDSTQKLAGFVLSDVSLTQKVLRLANTAFYRTSAAAPPVTTISRAIMLLGFETVKLSALAMLLVDRLPDTHQADNIRAELAQSLYASVIGRELARRSHYQGAEEVSIAALFKNLGRLLVVSYDHELYRRIETMIEAGTHGEHQACTLTLGCTYNMIAEAVMQEWQMPDTIMRCMVPLPPKVQRAPKNRQEWMQLVASFSSEAARLIPCMESVNGAVNSSAILQRYGQALNLDRDKVEQIFSNTLAEIRTLGDSFNLAVLPASSQASDSNALEVLKSEALLPDVATTPPVAASCYPSGKPFNAKDLLLAGLQQVTLMMASSRYKSNDLIGLVLQTLYGSMGFRFATVCLRDRNVNQYVAKLALGEQAAGRQAAFHFAVRKENDLFHLAMENNADLMISDSGSEKIQALLPAWYQKLLPDARSFILLPLVIEKVPLGFFYADRATTAPEGVSPEETGLIKVLKGQVLNAIKPVQ